MADLKIFTENIEETARKQINTLLEQSAFKDCKIRIMPDVHAGSGCVIGFTGDLGDKVIPNIVGVDIGCGMQTVELGDIDIDFEKLDKVIHDNVPSGFNVHENPVVEFPKLNELYCYDELRNKERIVCSIGTLGGGNHFIEVDIDEDNNKYLIIHSGSRNLGKQVADIYQELAIKTIRNVNISQKQNKIIEEYKASGREKEISTAIKQLKREYKDYYDIPKELCYLENENREKYLHDMEICQEFAVMNRTWISNIILSAMGWKEANRFETIHNYIDHDNNIVRKGAVSAYKGERLIIPINMRDGCIIGIGKGNQDWNYSAPHGAGRVMSRMEAKRSVSMNDFEKSMKGIYTTSVNQSTIDESPMAYKPMQEIIDCIGDTVEIERIIKPVYNFKASDE
jgi:RNA-splicing ligase RtcB